MKLDGPALISGFVLGPRGVPSGTTVITTGGAPHLAHQPAHSIHSALACFPSPTVS